MTPLSNTYEIKGLAKRDELFLSALNGERES
jgi:hypothetical protein